MSGQVGPGRSAGKPAGPAVPESGNGGRCLQCRPLVWPRVLCLPPHFILMLPPLSCRRSSQQTLSPLSSGLRGSGTRGGGAGAVGLLPVSLARVWQGVWPGCGPSPPRWELRPRGEESRGRGGLEVPSYPHSPTSHLPWGHIWARGNSMGGSLRKQPLEQGVCVWALRRCAYSATHLSSHPGPLGQEMSPHPQP